MGSVEKYGLCSCGAPRPQNQRQCDACLKANREVFYQECSPKRSVRVSAIIFALGTIVIISIILF